MSNGGDTDSQPSDNEQGNEETPSPAPEETPAEPEPSPAPDDSKDDSDDGNNGGYDFSTVEGPNGPMYGADYEDRKMRGQDVNQGADKPCPYELKTVTTRFFFDGSSYSNRQGYYYVAINSHGSENEGGSFDDLSYQMGKYNCTSKKVGMYSCGMVWFKAFDD